MFCTNLFQPIQNLEDFVSQSSDLFQGILLEIYLCFYIYSINVLPLLMLYM